jgi:site-specific recombinase XerC
VRRADVLRLVERAQQRGAGGSRTRGVLMPLRATFGRAIDLEQVSVNPVTGIKLPQAGKRLVIVPVEQAELMPAALAATDRRQCSDSRAHASRREDR